MVALWNLGLLGEPGETERNAVRLPKTEKGRKYLPSYFLLSMPPTGGSNLK